MTPEELRDAVIELVREAHPIDDIFVHVLITAYGHSDATTRFIDWSIRAGMYAVNNCTNPEDALSKIRNQIGCRDFDPVALGC